MGPPSAFRHSHNDAVALGIGHGGDASSLVIVDALPCKSLGGCSGNIGDGQSNAVMMKLHPAVEELLLNCSSELLVDARRQQGDRAHDDACTDDNTNPNIKVVTVQSIMPEQIRVGRFAAKYLAERNLSADQTLCVDLRLVHSDSQLFEEAITQDCYNDDDAKMCVSGLPTSYMKTIEQLGGVGIHRHRALLCIHHNLSGRLVGRGSYVVVALPPIWSSDATGSSSWDCLSLDPTSSLEADADEVAIFQVDSVRVIGRDELHEDMPQALSADGVRAGDDDDEESCYRLTYSEDSPKFSIRVFGDIEKARSNVEAEKEGESSKFPFAAPTNDYTTCPGYEDLVDELMKLAKIQHPSAAPSGVILTGCKGVGKSREASCLVDRLLQQASDGTVSRPIIRRISAKDILLAAASYVDLNILIDYVLGPTKAKCVARRVLVIDDLDSVIDPCGEESSASLNPERVLAVNAIIGAVDNLAKGMREEASKGLAPNSSDRYASMPFVLGLCCASSDQVLPNLVCVGRFEKVMTMAAPTQYQRRRIFQSMLEDLPLLEEKHDEEGKVARQWAVTLASQTAGFVASDMRRVCADALTRSQSRHLCSRSNNKSTIQSSVNKYSLSEARITWEDMRESARVCVPSQLARLDVTSTSTYTEQVEGVEVGLSDYRIVHEKAWSIFGGYDETKKRAYRTVVSPWVHETDRQEKEATIDTSDRQSTRTLQIKAKSGLVADIPPPSGVLFHGPSGVGKTLAAQCLASSLSLPVVKVIAADILDQWLGGSEAAIRSLFARARSASPCVLLFDDIDAIASNRNDDDGDSTNVQSRILSTLLNEMDGVSSQANRGGVLVLATTNRLSAIDSALLRPGRLEEHIELGLPSALDIEEILGLHLAKIRVHERVDVSDLAQRLESVAASGADVEGLCTGACLHAIRRATDNDIEETDKIALSSSDVDLAFRAINAQGEGGLKDSTS